MRDTFYKPVLKEEGNKTYIVTCFDGFMAKVVAFICQDKTQLKQNIVSYFSLTKEQYKELKDNGQIGIHELPKEEDKYPVEVGEVYFEM